MRGQVLGSLRPGWGFPAPARSARRTSGWPAQRGGVLRCSKQPERWSRNGESTVGRPVDLPADWDNDMAMLSVETLENEVARLKVANRNLKEKLENAGNRMTRSANKFFQADRSQAESSNQLTYRVLVEPETEPLEPETKPFEPETRAYQPETRAYQPDTRAYQPDTRAYQPDTRAYQPDTRAYQPDTRAYQPDTRAYQPDTRAYQPDTRAYQPDTRAYQPDTRAYQPNTRAYQPDTRAFQPDTKPLEPETQPLEPEAQPFQPETKPSERFVMPPPPIKSDDIEKAAAAAAIDFEGGGPKEKLGKTTRLNIVYVSAEVSPWSKTGGLGDVAGSLPVALAELGHRVMVVTPRYLNGVNDGIYADIHDKQCQVPLDLGHMGCQEVRFFHNFEKGVDWIFVDHPCFHRPGGPYGDKNGVFGDNLSRYAILSMAACEAPLHLYLPDEPTNSASTYGEDIVMVCNDWHTGLIPVYFEHKYRPHEVFQNAKCVLAIHNLAHQGIEDPSAFKWLGLPDTAFGALEWVAEDGHQSINIMKGAIFSSDRIVTVSRNHAWDITSKEGAMGLYPISSSRVKDMNGIVNGIDTKEWNPETDKFIEATYSFDDMEGKVECKASLQKELGFDVSRGIPLIGFVGRLDHQKGPDLVLNALDWLAMEDCQVVMLGSGMNDLEELMKEKEVQHRDFFRGWVGYSVPVSHRIIAGCDILLIPSRFEPCGLTQLYAMRYGTVPVAHATGGLSETIEDFNPFGKEESSMGTGWTFQEPTVDSMMETLKAALKVFTNDRRRWNSLRSGMLKDFSWGKSAALYESVFRSALEQEEI
ncbi:hypothetical protein BSKO_03157 [Bryopsis sp. KO-2023]|nr:hypothetical protein BSKO_03157 [Bryopsis sp. KO-2023]